jgi:hypothetical protein
VLKNNTNGNIKISGTKFCHNKLNLLISKIIGKEKTVKIKIITILPQIIFHQNKYKKFKGFAKYTETFQDKISLNQS